MTVLPSALSTAQLPLAHFSPASQEVLHNLGIVTVGVFLNTDWATIECKALSPEERAELVKMHTAMGQTPEDVRSWLNARANVLNLPEIWPNVVRFLVERGNERAYEVLSHRFRLDGRERLPLGELGRLLVISRERVRQIEVAALNKLRTFLDGGQLHTGIDQLSDDPERLRSALQSEVAVLFRQLEHIGFPLASDELWAIAEKRYGAAPSISERPFLELLLVVLGMESFHATPSDVLHAPPTLWLDATCDKPIIVAMANTSQHLLTHTALAVALPDLLSEVNGALLPLGRETDAASLRRILSLCPEVEAVGEDVYQARFSALSTIVLQLERIMRDLAAQGKVSASSLEITEEFNRRLALEGLPANISLRSVGGALSRTPPLTTIGKSGGWTLIENAGETRPLFEIMEEALQVLNRPASPKEIASYVLARRGASLNSVPGLLCQHPMFQRVGRGLYGLRSWGLEEGPPIKRGEEYQMEFDSALQEIFSENDGAPLRLSVLVGKLRQVLGWEEVAVRRRIENSVWLDFTPLGNRRLLAHLRETAKEENTPERESKRGQVQEAARRLLRASPEGQMTGRVLSALLEREMGFVRPTIYNSLANMSDVKRLGGPRNLTYQLVTPEAAE